jgi:excisionase family DNA binding protein
MKLIDAKAASKILGVRLARLYELVRRRVVPHVRLGPRQIRFDPERLAEWSSQGGTSDSVLIQANKSTDA